jgi:hypothetical protein
MHNAIFGLFVICGVLGGVVAPLRAQSLAEVALKEEERRKGGKEATKTYSNKDLSGTATAPAAAPDTAPAAGAPATPAADAAKGAAPEASKAPGTATAADAAAAEPPTGGTQGQTYWSGRISAARAQLARDEQFAEALQVQINALTTDFNNRDDPAQRSQVGASRQRAVSELDRVKKAIQDDKKAIAAVQEEARAAGVPAGWLR